MPSGYWKTPHVNFAISTHCQERPGSPRYPGGRGETELEEVPERLKANEVTLTDEGERSVAAGSEKSWLQDPSGIATWETYRTMEDVQLFLGETNPAEGACCTPDDGYAGTVANRLPNSGCCDLVGNGSHQGLGPLHRKFLSFGHGGGVNQRPSPWPLPTNLEQLASHPTNTLHPKPSRRSNGMALIPVSHIAVVERDWRPTLRRSGLRCVIQAAGEAVRYSTSDTDQDALGTPDPARRPDRKAQINAAFDRSESMRFITPG